MSQDMESLIEWLAAKRDEAIATNAQYDMHTSPNFYYYYVGVVETLSDVITKIKMTKLGDDYLLITPLVKDDDIPGKTKRGFSNGAVSE